MNAKNSAKNDNNRSTTSLDYIFSYLGTVLSFLAPVRLRQKGHLLYGSEKSRIWLKISASVAI